jgi:hypothetical protein
MATQGYDVTLRIRVYAKSQAEALAVLEERLYAGRLSPGSSASSDERGVAVVETVKIVSSK